MSELGPLQAYFDGEKQAGLFIAALGIASLAFAFWLYRDGGNFRAMLYPLAIIGLIQVAIGVGLYLRTPPQVAALEKSFSSGDAAAKEAERARMARVNANWKIIELAEVLIIALALIFILALKSRPVFVAVGMGLLIQASLLLAFDLFAEERARIYTEWLLRS